jgi:general stress protein 26
MDKREILTKIEYLLDISKTAILVTTDSQGNPHARWMTPTVLKYRPGAIFTFSISDTPKILRINTNPRVEWMLQNPNLTCVINISGLARAIDNPALKTELMDILGSRLTAFWKANAGKDDFVVLETVIEEASHMEPMTGLRETVKFT